jgi:hypothetical protein
MAWAALGRAATTTSVEGGTLSSQRFMTAASLSRPATTSSSPSRSNAHSPRENASRSALSRRSASDRTRSRVAAAMRTPSGSLGRLWRSRHSAFSGMGPSGVAASCAAITRSAVDLPLPPPPTTTTRPRRRSAWARDVSVGTFSSARRGSCTRTSASPSLRGTFATAAGTPKADRRRPCRTSCSRYQARSMAARTPLA